MGSGQILRQLRSHSRIALDSCIFIYHLENDPRFGSYAERVLRYVQDGQCDAVCSTIALLEIQVGAYRSTQEDLSVTYYALLREIPHLAWLPVTYETADRAAELRAEHDLGTPDAIHLATAIVGGATLFVTNDRKLARVKDLEILTLDR